MPLGVRVCLLTPHSDTAPRAVIASQNEVVTAADDDVEGDNSQVMNDWDDHLDDYGEEDRASSGGKKKKKTKKARKHQIADYD